MIVLLLNILKKIQKKLQNLINSNANDLVFGLNITEDLVVPAGTTLVLAAPGPGEKQRTFQYRNVTVEEGAVLTAASNPFVLQVTGKLTVNGHLNMDGKGGRCNDNHGHDDSDLESGAKNTGRWLGLTTPVGRGWCGEDATKDSWNKIFKHLKTENRLNLEFLVTGAGGGNRYRSGSGSHTSNNFCRGFANGGVPGDTDNLGGGAGGVLCVLYKKLNYKGKYYTTADNNKYPQNIQANGGLYARHWGQGWKGHNRGGGFMIVSANTIEVGPNGKISCNAGEDGNGPAAFLNLPPQQYYAPYPLWPTVNTSYRLIYDNGNAKFSYEGYSPGILFFPSNYDRRGGAGVCVGCDLGE